MIFDGNTDKKIKSYQKSFKKYGINPKAIQWQQTESATVRYKELVSDLDLEDKSILDVGCGFADMADYLLKKYKKIDYKGVDIVSEFIEICRKKYTNYKFVKTDYFSRPLKKVFDVILCSGAMNTNINSADIYRKKAIKTMFDHVKIALSFNLAGGYPQPKNNKNYRVYYSDSLEILKYCLKLTSKVILRKAYRDKDFTIVMFK